MYFDQPERIGGFQRSYKYKRPTVIFHPSSLRKAFLLTQACFIFTVFCAQAQSSVINTTDQKVDSLLNECRRVSQKPDSLLLVGAVLVDLGRRERNDRALIEGYFAKGLANYYLSDFNISVTFYDSAILIQEKDEEKYYRSLKRVVLNRGIVYDNLGKYVEAMKDYERLMQLGRSHHDRHTEALAYNQMGIAEKSQNKLEDAIKHHQLALHIWDSLGTERRLHGVLTNLGRLYKITGDMDGALQYDRIALSIARKNNMTFQVHSSYNNMAVNFRAMNLFDSSNFYLNTALEYYKENKMARFEAKVFQNIAHNLMLTTEYDSAKTVFKEALTGYDSIGYKIGEIEVNKLLGRTNFHMELFDSAIFYYGRALELSKKYKVVVEYVGIYEGVAKAYEGLGDFKSANEFLRYKEQIKDSTFSVSNLKTLSEVLTKYQVAQKDQEISSLNERKGFYETLLWPILLGVIGLVALAFGLYKKLYSSKKGLEKRQNELSALRGELQEMQIRREVVQELEPALIKLKSKALLPANEIMYISSDTHYLEFFIDGRPKPEVDRSTFKEIEELLPKGQFVRVHRSYLVNLSYIKIINSTKLMIQNETWIPISRTYKPAIMEVIKSGYNDAEVS